MPTPPRATTLDDAYRTCNHDKPLASDDQRYEDLSLARGDDTRRSIKSRITRAEPGEFAHIAFVSHRGAGKTTEILRICDDLKNDYFKYYFEANLELDERHITAEDLLLALAMGLEEHFAQSDLALPEALVADVQKWFSEIVTSTTWGKQLSADLGFATSVGFEVPIFAKLKTELKALLRTEGTYKTQVQEAFRRYPSTLRQHVNNLLDAANQRLGEKQLLVVIDNLDRYDPKVVDDLLFKGSRSLQQLRCHLIVTPPIALHFKPVSERIDQAFEPEQMFAVRLRAQEQPYTAFDPNARGRKLLLEALDKRMDVGKLIPDRAAQDRLVSASGGAIRDLLRLVRESIILAHGAVIDLPTIERAAIRLRSTFRDLINANGWELTLAKIMRDHRVSSEPACMDVLYQQLAFKYNGTIWYDVHPLVAELPEVLAAHAKFATESKDGTGSAKAE
ncbi:MAG: hypothetical protein IPF99_27725 [Deltaproteobacteria bacterium]|nr:hypothetical protein [Deltaproteobacteria bacterium]MBP6830219.1 hypothetical protein [Deltaproteobacteria bacterium]